jgi:hypothetical protein
VEANKAVLVEEIADLVADTPVYEADRAVLVADRVVLVADILYCSCPCSGQSCSLVLKAITKTGELYG